MTPKKKRQSQNVNQPERVDAELAAAPAIDEQAAGSEPLKQRYGFPTVSVCPRCRGKQTRAVSTQGRTQYRACQAPICQHRFTVQGTPV